jgi:outer membrane protein assembly factor BamB
MIKTDRLLNVMLLTTVWLGTAPFLLAEQSSVPTWDQWRGPTRDGLVSGTGWPSTLSDQSLTRSWRVELDSSYSGPIVSESTVFVTGTRNKKSEVITALDRTSGEKLWEVEWPGTMTVPFFASANGSWIRSTPAYDGSTLYVAGMCDVLVALDGKSGKERWRVDFVKEFKTTLPTFGCVSSPLIDGDFLFVQAGGSLVKLNKSTGKVIWRTLEDGGGMMGGAFSSPTMATSLAGRRQLVVQTREKMAGVDPETGKVLWERNVPSFRGMNILTPLIVGDSIFTSTYQNKSWRFDVTNSDGSFATNEAWNNKSQGYMSTPVVIDGYVYLHLQNQRFTCINFSTGAGMWTSQPYGKYSSLVAQKDRILALDQSGKLLLIKANPNQFELIDERQISDQETWAHLAVCGEELYVRELNALSTFHWKKVRSPQ